MRAPTHCRPFATLVLAGLVLAACGGDDNGDGGDNGTGPSTGSIAVSTTTTGSNLDPDGYTVSLDDGAEEENIAANGTVTFSEVATGEHEIELRGVAENCTVTDNPRTVRVRRNATAEVTFHATCAGDGNTGSITVTTTTTGDNLDPDGYTVALDGAAGQPIGANANVTIPNVAAGTHSVALSGVAANCTVTENPQSVTVTAGSTTQVAFSITCTSATGTMQVTTTTTGENADPDGYTVSVDGGAAQAIGINDTLIISDVPAGEHSVELSSVDDDACVVAVNPITATVAPGDTAAADFVITCGGGQGSPPVLSNVQAPATITNTPGDSSLVTFDFADPDGDIVSAIVEIIADPNDAYFFNPGDSVSIPLDVQGQTTGSLGLLLGCPDTDVACPLGTGPVTLGLSLLDAQGNSSDQVQFSFEIVAPNASTALRAGNGAKSPDQRSGRTRRALVQLFGRVR